MKPWEVLAETSTPDRHRIRLARRDDEYLISMNGKTLMSSRMHGSEEVLATAACRHLRTVARPRVLVGGLGMGFTLAAALEVVSSSAIVIVAELLPAVVEWNRGPLGSCAGYPLTDRRVRIAVVDVGVIVRSKPDHFDAILLDVDNGPAAFATPKNQALYDDAGVGASYAALRSGGALAVWSAWHDREFEKRLRVRGFSTHVERVRDRRKTGGSRHTIFVGRKHGSPFSQAMMAPLSRTAAKP
jgi:spermidine synthase